MFLLNILWSLLDGGNWWRSSWKILFPIFVETALLKGRLNQMMLRCRFLFVLLLLETNQPWNCRLFRHHVQLNNGTYRPYKNPNNLLLYINKSSNHPPQIINQLPKIINERLSRNSSNEEVFNSSKYQYEKALRDSGYTDFKLQFNKTSNNHTKRNRQRNIIWFDPPFSRAISTNVGKRFLQLLRHHFPPSNKLHKIFNKNTVKVSYCCTQNVASIIKSHNKKLINTSIKNTLPCNCRKKHECPLDGKCRAENIVYKCVASVHGYPNKVYLGTAEGDFKQRFYNHQMSFNNEGHSTDTTFSKCIWEVKRKLKIMPSLKWHIIKSVPAYSNISKKCQLCLQEKFEILNYPNPNELLNKRSELISKCRHVNKFLLSNYKSND